MKYILLMFFLGFSFFTLMAQSQETSSVPLKKNAAPPSVKLLKSDSSATNFKKLLIKGIPTVVLFFSPDCDHCQHQTKEIVSHIDELSRIRFVLVSNRPLFMLKTFSKEFGLDKCKNITLVQDAGNQLTRYYDVGGYPSMLVLNGKGVPVEKFVSSIVNKSGILFSAKKQ